jgi:hypothetical protein
VFNRSLLIFFSILVSAPYYCFAITIMGYDVQETANVFKESATNFVNGVVTFDATKIFSKQDEVIAIIRSRREENFKILRSGSPEAVERELEEVKRNCSNINLFNKLTDSILNSCQFEEVAAICDNSNNLSSEILDRNNINISKITGNSIIDKMRVFKTQVTKARSKIFNLNQKCLNTYDRTIKNPNCLNAYENVFNDSMNNYLKYNCKEEDVKEGVNTYISFMRSPERGIGVYISRIQDAYAQSRTTEAGIAKIEANITDTIIEWEKANPRNPAGDAK